MTNHHFDIVIAGNYTKDTIISPAGTRYIDGGGFNYGAHAAAMMGLKTAAVTRLAAEDIRVVHALELAGVTVFPTYTPLSTTIQLYYPTTDPDTRIISMGQSAGPFVPAQVCDIEAQAFLLNGSVRDEMPLEFIDALRAKHSLLAADAQAFVRCLNGGVLQYGEWPQKLEVLSRIDILKADIVEAEFLTGTNDLPSAARAIAAWGPKEVVLTNRDGVLVLAGGRIYDAAFQPRQYIGRSGRGDTCIAAYVARRLSHSPQEATIWAAAVTSLKLEAEGPIKRTLDEVDSLIARSYSAAL